MALINLIRISLKYPNSFNNLRTLSPVTWCQRINWYSLSKEFYANYKTDQPVKFTTSKADRVTIAENLAVNAPFKNAPRYQPHIVLGTIVIFMIYFCILREENDIDEMLKGNSDYDSEYTKYVKLHMYLKYCEQNKLPTTQIKAKLEELEEQFQKAGKKYSPLR